jgi:N-acetylglutamate synthase-like GNAT family acetyltransferase
MGATVEVRGGFSVEIRKVDFDDLDLVAREAKREGLSFKPTQKTDWFGVYLDDELIGCGGTIWPKAGVARLKSGLVLPEWRRLGIYHAINRYRIKRAFSEGAERVTVISRFPDAYRGYGFVHTEGKKPSHLHMTKEMAETQGGMI